MHEGNTFSCYPVSSMVRDFSFDSPCFLQSDPNLQEVAVTADHVENDMANCQQQPSTSQKTVTDNNILYKSSCETFDTSFIYLMNKNEFNIKSRPPTSTIKPLQQQEETPETFFTQENANNSLNDKKFQQDNKNTTILRDISDFLVEPNSKSGDKIKSPDSDDNFCAEYVSAQKTGTGSSKGPSKSALTARANRLKKKNYVKSLEIHIENLEKENRSLNHRLKSVTAESEKRGSQIEYLKGVLLNDEKIYRFLKNIPYIKSVGFPQEQPDPSTSYSTNNDNTNSRTMSEEENNFSATPNRFPLFVQNDPPVVVAHDPPGDNDSQLPTSDN